ncbi:MAG: hypothetical protein WBA98_03690 [Gordonia sp. (in: high G+C Gram-positive bacteria)]|uniref:hypothetical protein n=1 Tax=Gordonia sp. (in: high G+C Gram-positive bacteria) TaxID=84139 RepID=UPI003C75909B
MKALKPEQRQYIYVTLTALLPILAGFGYITESDIGMWLALAAAVLGAGGTALAAKHVPDASDYVGAHRRVDDE